MSLELGRYKSASQRARIFSEHWIEANFDCPKCLGSLERTPNNTSAKDFVCAPCGYGFELKSKQGLFGNQVVDGAYQTMLASIRSDARPHLLLLSYTTDYQVREVTAVPRQFLIEEIVIPRKPLGQHCRRAGWQGCNLNIAMLPPDGRISFVSNFKSAPRAIVSAAWERAEFLDNFKSAKRSWIAVTMALVRKLGKSTFTLGELYELEGEAAKAFPNNAHIKEKLRQQLQCLRDKGWLHFEGRGNYCLSETAFCISS
jgi:type II restriction enzyme